MMKEEKEGRRERQKKCKGRRKEECCQHRILS